jgi:hypothetical protein
MGLQAARSVVPRMLLTFRWFSLDSGFVLANVLSGLDRQGWITFFAAILLALITLFAGYDHVDLLGAASVDLPQQAGIPCIAAAVATAFADAQLASNDRQESAAIRAGAEDFAREESDRAAEERNRATEERERAALRAQQQARCNRVQLCHQLDPNEANAQRVRDVISLLDEYGGLA